jgi:exopolyphosphatase/guanosine-5'-triphosphate,3'-diphosphate pyrophosphatase
VLLDFAQQFHLPAVYYSRAGVRDGIIADLAARNVGAERSRLSRDQRREVEEMARRYGVPLERARKVAHDANLLFSALQPIHGLPPDAGKLLEAAAYLCDVGHYVSSASHHKHAYYVVANSDMAGFTDRERLLIASLCRYHRKSLPGPLHSAYQILTADERRTLMQLIPILRLADNLDRSHNQRLQRVDVGTRDGEIVLQVHSNGNLDLEQWRAERAGEAFRREVRLCPRGEKGHGPAAPQMTVRWTPTGLRDPESLHGKKPVPHGRGSVDITESTRLLPSVDRAGPAGSNFVLISNLLD